MLTMLTFLAAQAAAPCVALPGIDALLATPKLQWLMLGEQHGTSETPAAFADIVCHASRARRPVIVALEMFESEQPAIETFLTSDGGPAARAALLTSATFAAKMQDGRGSTAMLTLLDRLRMMKMSGRIRRVMGFRPDAASGNEAVEAGMADILRRAAADGSLVVAMAGNVHAAVQPVTFGDRSYLPAAARLPRESTRTLNARGNGGAQWSCFMAPTNAAPGGSVTCGARDFGPAAETMPRGIVLDPAPDARWSGQLNLGVATSAAPPATSR